MNYYFFITFLFVTFCRFEFDKIKIIKMEEDESSPENLILSITLMINVFQEETPVCHDYNQYR